MKSANLIAIFICSSVAISGCDNKSSEKTYDAGYSDGCAVGYNTACKIRATMVYGHFDSEEYSRGYSAGQTDGIMACNRERDR